MPRDPAAGVARIREAMAAAGRADDPLQVVGSLPADLDDVPTLVAAGVTDFRFSRIPADPAEAEDLLADLVAQFRAVTGAPAAPA